MTSLALGDRKAGAQALSTAAATVTVFVGFPVLFFAFGILALGASAILAAALGPTAGTAPGAPLAPAGGRLAVDLGVAAANFLVAWTVLSLAQRLFRGARHRLTLFTFAAGYTVLAGAVTLTTEINLGWSVTGVLVACALRFVHMSAVELR